MRLLSMTMLAGLLLSSVLWSQEKKDPPKKAPDREDQLEEIIKDYVKVYQTAAEAEAKATTEAEKKAAAAKKPKEADFMPRLFKFIEAEPKDTSSLDALGFAFYGLQTKDDKAVKLLLDNFGKSKKMERFVAAGLEADAETNKTVKPIMEKLLAESPEKSVKGLAALALANAAAADEKEAKSAEALYERVEKEFGKEEFGDQTLGEMAQSGLRELRVLGIGKPAPAAESVTLKGEKTSLADHKGKVIVLDIWATWCGPCRAMIPHEREMVTKLKDKPFSLISVSVDNDKETLEQFLEKEKMPWTHWYVGPKGPLLKTYNVRFFPTIYVIDAKGIIRYKNIRGEELEQAVDKLIAEVKK
jgi:thiol-disulfide isomerase/thioredoxin